MDLYHYTSVTLAGAIFSSHLLGSHYKTQDKKTVGPCVWLTSSPDSKGHGLPTGEKLTATEAEYLERIGRPPKNLSTHSKDKIRIKIDYERLPSWALENTVPSGLIKYTKLSKMLGDSARWRKAMGLSCYYDLRSLSDEELLRHFKRTKTMEDSWWLYFGSIQVELIESVAFKTPAGFVPYDFEDHGRQDYVADGLHVVSKPLLAEFHELFPPMNSFETPHAAVFCATAKSKPSVAFQAHATTWDIDLQDFTPTPRLGQLPENISHVVDWTRRHRDELMGLWPAAVDSYNQFYPDNPAPLPAVAD